MIFQKDAPEILQKIEEGNIQWVKDWVENEKKSGREVTTFSYDYGYTEYNLLSAAGATNQLDILKYFIENKIFPSTGIPVTSGTGYAIQSIDKQLGVTTNIHQ